MVAVIVSIQVQYLHQDSVHRHMLRLEVLHFYPQEVLKLLLYHLELHYFQLIYVALPGVDLMVERAPEYKAQLVVNLVRHFR